ncbi:MAG: restriction endonuclease subunit S [Gammaproteobacteria bacterium]|nr:restriction endonuclease subunit S [Gammaproteobacteria bacterium]
MGVKEVSATYSSQQSVGIPKGYKQTEVGVIPEDWEVGVVREIASIRTGPFGTLLKASEYSGKDGVPLISVGEIRKGFLEIDEHTPRVSEIVTRRLPQYVLRKGDIVFGRKGGVERSALIKETQDGWFLGSDGIAVRALRRFDHEYLAFQFQSSRIQNWLLQNAIGTTMPSLNQDILGRVLVAIPSESAEQEAIAEVLRDADALIESLEQLLTKKRQLKQGAMQELLTGKTRLPGFSGEWKVTSLSALCGMKSGDGITSADIDDYSPYPCYGGNGLRGYASRFTHDGGFALIGRQGALCGNVVGVEGKFFASEHAVVVTPYSQTDIRWLTYVLATMNLNQYSESSAQPGLSVSKILMLDLDFPPTKSEQTAIAAILADMDAELATLEEKLTKACAAKQGMMQELLTGRIRLVNA